MHHMLAVLRDTVQAYFQLDSTTHVRWAAVSNDVTCHEHNNFVFSLLVVCHFGLDHLV